MQEREQLDLFRALPGDMAPRDSQDLMAIRSSPLAKSKRVKPIDFRTGNVTIRVEGTQEHGIADLGRGRADLGGLADRGSEGRGLRPSRLMHATPYEILRFIGRGGRCATTSASRRPWIACNRPRWPRPSARRRGGACTASRGSTNGRELADASGTPLGIELILPDWFFAGVLDAALVR